MAAKIHNAKTNALTEQDVGIVKAAPLKPTRGLGTAAGLITWKTGWEKPLNAKELDEFLRSTN